MTNKTFRKTLSANDVGATGAHQAGMLVPKSEKELLSFLPKLDTTIKNPDAWIVCVDERGAARRFRFVYYNNKFHDEAGTRDEYRITHMTSYLREMKASKNDVFEISGAGGDGSYVIRVISEAESSSETDAEQGVRIKIKSLWRRVH